MEFGNCLAARPEDIDDVVKAERLGFTHHWAAAGQMIWSDVHAVLALIDYFWLSRVTSEGKNLGVRAAYAG